jgi:DNA polymerase-1
LNFQNLPRDDKTVKTAILPKRGALSEFDYSQIEPRLFAYLSAKVLKDDSIAEWYRQGRDYYDELAAIVHDKPLEEVTKAERQDAKAWFLMSLYMAGPRKIAESVGISEKEAKAFYKAFHARLPQIKLISNPRPKRADVPWTPGAMERMYQRRGFLKTPFGNHIHAEQFGEHKLLNKWIQGTAAYVMKAAIVLVDRWLRESGLESRIVGTIHDSLVIDGPVSELALLHEHVPRLMIEAANAPAGDDINEWVPFAVDHDVSTTNWAAKIPYDEWVEAHQEVAVGR